jgi:hypothetical protein
MADITFCRPEWDKLRQFELFNFFGPIKKWAYIEHAIEDLKKFLPSGYIFVMVEYKAPTLVIPFVDDPLYPLGRHTEY